MAGDRDEVESVTVVSPFGPTLIEIRYRGNVFHLPQTFVMHVTTTSWVIAATLRMNDERASGPIADVVAVSVNAKGVGRPVNLRDVERIIRTAQPLAIEKATWVDEAFYDGSENDDGTVHVELPGDNERGSALQPLVELLSKKRGRRPATHDKVERTVRVFRSTARQGRGLMDRYDLTADELKVHPKTVQRHLDDAVQYRLMTQDERGGK